MRASHPEPMRRSQRWIHCWIGSALFLKACHWCHADLSLREALPQSYPHTYQNNPRKFRPYSTDLDTHTQGCTPDHPPPHPAWCREHFSLPAYVSLRATHLPQEWNPRADSPCFPRLPLPYPPSQTQRPSTEHHPPQESREDDLRAWLPLLAPTRHRQPATLSLIHISEPTRLRRISYAV